MAACKGAFTARTSTGGAVIFAGDSTKLYKFVGAGDPWTDVSRLAGGAYVVPSDGYWSFDQFDNILIAVNGVDNPQYINVDSGANFALLPGSPPISKYIKVVGDFVMMLDLTSALGGIASSGSIQCAWSGLRDYDYWTYGLKSSGYATFWSGGFVRGCTTQLGGLLFQQRSINRMVRRAQGVPAFDFAPILENQGTDSPYSIVTHEGTSYFYGTDGFMAIGAQGIKQIGFERVDNWLLDRLDQVRVGEIVGALDPIKMRVVWAFPTSNALAGQFDHAIAYDILLDEWTHAPIDMEYLFQAASPGMVLADVAALYGTLDQVPYPLGSRVWSGGAPGLGAFDTSHRLAMFAGLPMEAIMQTSLVQPIPGKRTAAQGFRIIGDAENATGRVATSERPQTAAAWGNSSSMVNGTNFVPIRAAGRYLRVETRIAAGEDWIHSQGIDMDDSEIVSTDGER